jgi:uncharacterized membrane protein YfcA
VLLRLVVIGLAAGFFGALFGVGGGIVMVPLLIALVAFAARPATATSLAAIGLIAVEGVVVYSVQGHVKPVDAVVLGVPAAAGALLGTAVQQRLENKTISLAFAALLLGVAIRLFVG